MLIKLEYQLAAPQLTQSSIPYVKHFPQLEITNHPGHPSISHPFPFSSFFFHRSVIVFSVLVDLSRESVHLHVSASLNGCPRRLPSAHSNLVLDQHKMWLRRISVSHNAAAVIRSLLMASNRFSRMGLNMVAVWRMSA